MCGDRAVTDQPREHGAHSARGNRVTDAHAISRARDTAAGIALVISGMHAVVFSPAADGRVSSSSPSCPSSCQPAIERPPKQMM